MKKAIDIETWNRKGHFKLFSSFEEPFWGVVISLDCTIAYQQAKQRQQSFYLYYLYRVLKAVNSVDAFRLRIIGQEVFLFDQINVSATVDRPDGTFGFSYIDYHADEQQFHQHAQQVIAEVRAGTGLLPTTSGKNEIHFSALPWLNFTSISHARSFSFEDSMPKISVGKLTEQNGVRSMPVSIHVHHALVDGRDVGLFAETLQREMYQQ